MGSPRAVPGGVALRFVGVLAGIHGESASGPDAVPRVARSSECQLDESPLPMRRVRWLALGVLVSGEGPSSLLELTEANFDVLLREVPVALVAYVNPTTDLHYPRLRPNLLALADAYAHAGRKRPRPANQLC